MATFVLVHGAWHGSWCWKRVRTRLQALGHEVFTPTLTGVGERAHLSSPLVNLEMHVLDVHNLLQWEELSDVVLCGHSYGGCVVAGVADRAPKRVRALVYLDAFVLNDGESLADHIPDVQFAQIIEQANASGDGWKVQPIPAAVFNVNAADRDWVDQQCTAQSLETFRQPIRLTGGVGTINNVTFVLAEGFRDTSPFRRFYEAAVTRGWKALTIDCGHDVMLDKPHELADILISASER